MDPDNLMTWCFTINCRGQEKGASFTRQSVKSSGMDAITRSQEPSPVLEDLLSRNNKKRPAWSMGEVSLEPVVVSLVRKCSCADASSTMTLGIQDRRLRELVDYCQSWRDVSLGLGRTEVSKGR